MDRPILFKPELVRRIATKTKTRRLPSVQPPPGAHSPTKQPDPRCWLWRLKSGGGFQCWHRFGLPGDRLWVKETWAYGDTDRDEPPIVFRADVPGDERVWRSPLHLRKVDARYWLTIIAVKPERLQQVDDAEARAEGFDNREDFLAAWDWINGGGGIGLPHSSASNPWVWVISFELERAAGVIATPALAHDVQP